MRNEFRESFVSNEQVVAFVQKKVSHRSRRSKKLVPTNPKTLEMVNQFLKDRQVNGKEQPTA